MNLRMLRIRRARCRVRAQAFGYTRPVSVPRLPVRLPLLFILAAALAATPASAIQIRADRDDEEYRELATRYASAVALPGGGAGVLIAPRWVLTIASRGQALASGASIPAIPIRGKPHAVLRIWIHPDAAKGLGADVALALLADAATNIEPTPIYRQADESGQAIRMVGFGPSGAIGKPPVASDGRARAAINTVDREEPLVLGMQLKGPDDASDLQGAETSADSGGPAFIEVARRPYVAGLILPPARTGASAVGDWTRLVRVSAFGGWIDEVMGRAALEEAAKPMPPAPAKR